MTEQLDLNDNGPKLTVGILTLNEEKRIASCINSAKFADQILVIDSGSKDKTCDIAAALGAEVYSYSDWRGFAVQRNRVLQHAKGEYIFFLDADEEMPPEMQAEIEAVIASGGSMEPGGVWQAADAHEKYRRYSAHVQDPIHPRVFRRRTRKSRNARRAASRQAVQGPSVSLLTRVHLWQP